MTEDSEALGFPEEYYIVDVGMNDGKDADYYAKRGFKVIACDANPVLVAKSVNM